MRRGLVLLAALACWAAAAPARGEEPAAPVLARLTLDRAAQVRFGLHHWSGPRDGSITLSLWQEGQRLLIEATLRDDTPFLQPRPGKVNPDWWKIEYGADGLRFILHSREDPSQTRCDFLLDFDSQAMRPRILVVASERGQPKALSDTRLKFTRKPGTMHFLLSLPLDQLLKTPVTLAQTELEVRLYDLDSEMEDYTLLSDTVALEEKDSEDRSQESE